MQYPLSLTLAPINPNYVRMDDEGNIISVFIFITLCPLKIELRLKSVSQLNKRYQPQFFIIEFINANKNKLRGLITDKFITH